MMVALQGVDSFVAGLVVGGLAGAIAAPRLWRWVAWHSWKAADREVEPGEAWEDLPDLTTGFDPPPLEDRQPVR